jgi:copper(I)-binding protein
MRMVPTFTVAVAAAAMGAALTLASCSQPKVLYGDHAWVRLGAVKGRPAAAYLNIHGGPTPATLIGITTDVAIRAELHQSMQQGRMATMKPLAKVEIPANQVVKFEPGGMHVMFFDMNPGIKPGSTITLTLTFADGTRILQDAGVIGAGDPAPE